MKRHLVLAAVVLILAVFGGSPVEGSPITYYLSGTVVFGYGSLEPLKGTPVSGWLLYDPAWPLVPPQVGEYSIPAGTVALTTVYGNSVSTPGPVWWGRWGISPTDTGMWLDPLFDESSALGAASFVLRGPGGSPDHHSPPPPLPPDLAGFKVYRLLRMSSRGTSGSAEADVGCFSADARECGLAPIPEPASLFLFGAGLVGLRAWRKR